MTTISTTLLDTIHKMSEGLKDLPNGGYSITTFMAYGEIREPESDISGHIYHRDREHGDSVSVGVIIDNTYTGKRAGVWADTYADEGVYMTDKTPTGQVNEWFCFRTLKDVNTLYPERGCYWSTSKFVMIAPGHVGYISCGDGRYSYISIEKIGG